MKAKLNACSSQPREELSLADALDPSAIALQLELDSAGTGNKGRGEAHTIMRMRAFSRKNGRLYARPHNGGSAGSLQRSGFRENSTNILTFVAR